MRFHLWMLTLLHIFNREPVEKEDAPPTAAELAEEAGEFWCAETVERGGIARRLFDLCAFSSPRTHMPPRGLENESCQKAFRGEGREGIGRGRRQ